MPSRTSPRSPTTSCKARPAAARASRASSRRARPSARSASSPITRPRGSTSARSRSRRHCRPTTRRSWELHHGLGEALMRSGDVERSRASLHAALEHAAAARGSRALRAVRARLDAAGVLARGRRRASSPRRLEEALRRLDGADPAGIARSAPRSTPCAAACACSSRSRCSGRRELRAPRAARRRGVRDRARDLLRRARAQLAGAADARRPHARVRARAGLPRDLGARQRGARPADLRRSARALRPHPRRRARHAGAAVAHQPVARARRSRPRRDGDRGLRRDRAPARPAAHARLRPAASRAHGQHAR